jgi:iron complex transport system substrate-binding protein
MLGWNIELSGEAKKYLMKEYASLPVLGNMYGTGEKANAEEILKYEPDVVLLADTKATDKVKTEADELQAKLGVPVVVIVASVDN